MRGQPFQNAYAEVQYFSSSETCNTKGFQRIGSGEGGLSNSVLWTALGVTGLMRQVDVSKQRTREGQCVHRLLSSQMKRYACTAYDGSREDVAVLVGKVSLLSVFVSDQRRHSLAYVTETVLTPEETGQSCRKLRQFCGSCRSCAASSAVRPCEKPCITSFYHEISCSFLAGCGHAGEKSKADLFFTACHDAGKCEQSKDNWATDVISA